MNAAGVAEFVVNEVTPNWISYRYRPRRIEQIEIRNYRCLRRAVFVDLSQMTVIVGTSGSGRSTMFDVFDFLKDTLARNVGAAVVPRSGFREQG